jgi:hypothetical protein
MGRKSLQEKTRRDSGRTPPSPGTPCKNIDAQHKRTKKSGAHFPIPFRKRGNRNGNMRAEFSRRRNTVGNMFNTTCRTKITHSQIFFPFTLLFAKTSNMFRQTMVPILLFISSAITLNKPEAAGSEIE